MYHSLKIIVSGKVHAVNFRIKTREIASKLGLVGFVRNQIDGTVLIKVSGSQKKTDLLLDWINTQAPGRVDDVKLEEIEQIEYNQFNIEY